jgi:predicted O-methyltransferase YrrM
VIPPRGARAQRLAEETGFAGSCRDEDGLLLHVLAARRGVARAGEIGTGCGVGAAWIVSALAPATPFVTVEGDPDRSAVARDLFADDPNVIVLTGHWRRLLPDEAPFDLLFVDAHDAKDDPEAVIGLLAPGGTVVLDDFTAGFPVPDARRAPWLRHPALQAIVVGTGDSAQAIICVRVHGL